MRTNDNAGLDRRGLFTASAAMLALPAAARAMDSTKDRRPPGAGRLPDTPLGGWRGRSTAPVRGFVAGDVYTFKGVPYGQTTAGANRWLPAKPPEPWTEPRATLAYGANCPQTLHDFNSVEMAFLFDWDDGWLSEDMLKLNVWTPALTGSRPVMVYFHGGGYSFGSAYELPSHEGAQMARHHDVVQVSVNHRLNALGFLDVSEAGGPAYEGSVNVGMTDLVASLRWVRENIANFGGDPDRVMIYGQSGGGSKVTTLLGMPSATGADAPSRGAVGRRRQHSRSGAVARVFPPADARPRRRPRRHRQACSRWTGRRCSRPGNKVADAMNPPRGAIFGPGMMKGPPRVGWGPTLDGRVIPIRSFQDAVADSARSIPVMIGSVSEEGFQYHLNPTEAEWRSELATTYGADKAGQLVHAMMTAHPEKAIPHPVLRRLGARRTQPRAADGGPEAPPGRARRSTSTSSPGSRPSWTGIAGAWHTSELAFCFDNTKRCEQGTGNTPQAQR